MTTNYPSNRLADSPVSLRASIGFGVGAALRRDSSKPSRHKAAPTVCSNARPRRGFTLIELLTVIAIIGILAALIFPSVGGANRTAKKAKTKVQFSQWAAAIEGFRSEYGYYPAFHSSNLVNPSGQSTTANALHLFHDLLAAKRRDGSALPTFVAGADSQFPEVQNRKLISFCSFSGSDLVDAGSASPNLIRDAFDNTAIAVLVDKNLDGVINGADYPGGFPLVASVQPSSADIPATGVRAGVIFYAPSPTSTTASPDFIFSWK